MSIDLPTFRELQQTAGSEFVVELGDTFLDEAPRTLSEMRSAWHDKSPDRFRRAAHSLKSNGLTFGATGFAAIARELEMGEMPVDPTPIETLERSYDAAAQVLRDLCRG